MNIKITFAVILIFAIAALFIFFQLFPKSEPAQQNIIHQNINNNQPNHMKITSPAFENNTDIPSKYTCDGKNINPALAISDVPPDAKSLAMIMDDPDAPLAGGFVHWVVFNFDPKTSEIAENSVPAGAIQGQNSSGESRYTGPCPPSGTHHYHFKLYALNFSLILDSSAKREDLEKAMEGHILDRAELIGLYKRP